MSSAQCAWTIFVCYSHELPSRPIRLVFQHALNAPVAHIGAVLGLRVVGVPSVGAGTVGAPACHWRAALYLWRRRIRGVGDAMFARHARETGCDLATAAPEPARRRCTAGRRGIAGQGSRSHSAGSAIRSRCADPFDDRAPRPDVPYVRSAGRQSHPAAALGEAARA